MAASAGAGYHGRVQGQCYRHPEQIARRRCFQCREPICPTCQVHLDSHIFCGHRCHGLWQRSERRARWRRRLNRAQRWWNPVLWWRYPPFARNDWARRATLLLWLLLGVQLATVAVLFVGPGRETPAAVPSGPSQTSENMPRWLEPPQRHGNRIDMTAAAGSDEALILRNGVVVAELAPSSVVQWSAPPGRGPSSWDLRPRSALGNEIWVDPLQPGNHVEQIPAAGGLALTFDGGADANVARMVLAALRDHGVRATFFLTGEFVRRYPDLTRRIVAQGHEVGNHTWSHPSLTRFNEIRRHETRPDMTRERFELEMLRTENLFLQVTGQPMAPLWRAPYGEINAEINGWAADLGYRHIGWTRRGGRERSFDTLDWVASPADPLYVSGRDMAARILRQAREPAWAGSIVLMHLGVLRRNNRIQDELQQLIPALQAAGVRLGTIGEMLPVEDS